MIRLCFLPVALVLSLAAAPALAQSNATQATATVTGQIISTAINIAKLRDMNLGAIAAPSSGAYTVTLAPGGGRSGAGGVGGQVIGGSGTTALFNVAGEENRAFAITTPATVTLTTGAGGPGREVVFTPTHATTATLDSDGSGFGVKQVEVYGALSVPASSVAGPYATSLPVTVQYQ